MSRYLLSVHSVDGEASAPMTAEDVRRVTGEVRTLEDEMRSSGTWLLGGRLHGPDAATVVRLTDGRALTTDGPFAESKEHLAGFYVIEAADLDVALAWATRVASIVGRPIEVRPFAEEPDA